MVAAAGEGLRVKALGSRHSFSAVADTDGVHVVLRGLGTEPALEGELVVVPGATTYAELAAWLHARGRALHNMGSLPHISVAGACATGTHGSGDANGSLATAVRALELVTASGDVVRFAAGDPDFPGAVLSLGALGVVTRLWLATQPAYEVAQRVWTGLPTEAVAEQADAVLGSGYSVSVFTDLSDPTTLSSVWVKDRLDRPGTLAPVLAEHASADHEVHPVPGIDPAPATVQQGVPGPWHERLPHFRAGFVPSVGEEIQTEYFVPRAAAGDVVRGLASVAAELAPALMVHELRSVAADDLWLSPVRGRDSVAVHFTWKRDPALVEPAVRVVEQLLAPLDPRAHWGKVADGARGPAGPGLEQFRALRDRLDPDRVLGNAFLDQHL